jgi:hypothetical protein
LRFWKDRFRLVVLWLDGGDWLDELWFCIGESTLWLIVPGGIDKLWSWIERGTLVVLCPVVAGGRIDKSWFRVSGITTIVAIFFSVLFFLFSHLSDDHVRRLIIIISFHNLNLISVSPSIILNDPTVYPLTALHASDILTSGRSTSSWRIAFVLRSIPSSRECCRFWGC